jgi:iron complex outermembrane receptor protein
MIVATPPPPPPPEPPELAPVQVVATRTPAPTRAVPAAVSVVQGEALERPSANANLSEKLQQVPGLLARERQNYAQDLQVSVRGFGARATFGIRGIRLYLDGVPATMPDGQGQVSNFNLASLGRIEVLRGPFSALYGNAAGGVVHAFTADGADDPGWRLGLAAGADALQRETIDWRGASDALDHLLDATRLRTDGYREHGAAARDAFNLKLRYAPTTRSKLTLVANGLDSPEAQDPLGLTAAQVEEDPRQAAPAALLFDTRKALRHQQLGLVFEQETGAGDWRLQVHGGRRRVLQFLSVPAAAQANPLSGGGVVDLDSGFSGVDMRWSRSLGTLTLVLGATSERQDQHRLGFENFEGSQLGVRGRLRRDQDDFVGNTDLYAQASWQVREGSLLMAGLRRSRVWFRSDDDYVDAQNPDDSGSAHFSASTPVFGASQDLGAHWTAYASHGRGFETPTFDELGYRPDGSAGLNFDLRPARTRSTEAGVRARYAHGLAVDFTVFRADTRDELAVASNAGGRSTYRNIGRARRQGVEAFATWPIAHAWRGSLSATWMQASYRDAFLACAGSPCPAPTVPVAAGAEVPGVPRAWWSLGADYDAGGRWQARVELRHVGSVPVDNARALHADAYTVAGLEAAWRLPALRAGSRLFLRVDNLFDRRYVGSVIVNEANGRFFEPAPGRAWVAGADLRW